MYCPAISSFVARGYRTRTPSFRSRKSEPCTHISILTSPRPQSLGRRQLGTSCAISSRAPSVQRGDPMSRNPKRKEVTKRAVLAELERLRQGRHARYQTLIGRFSRCQDWQKAASLCAAAVNASARTNNRTPLDAPPGWLPPV